MHVSANRRVSPCGRRRLELGHSSDFDTDDTPDVCQKLQLMQQLVCEQPAMGRWRRKMNLSKGHQRLRQSRDDTI